MRILDLELNDKTEMSDIVLWKMQYQDQCGGLSRTRSGNPPAHGFAATPRPARLQPMGETRPDFFLQIQEGGGLLLNERLYAGVLPSGNTPRAQSAGHEL